MPVSIAKLRLITGAVVVAAAAGSGYYMQSGAPGTTTLANAPVQATISLEALAADQAPRAPAYLPEADAPLVTRAATQPVALLQEDAPNLPVPGTPEAATLTPVMAEPSQALGEGAPAASAAGPSVECEVGFTANAAPGAMVELTLEAPCYGGQTVDIFHARTRFSTMLDERGLMQVAVPALEEDAFFNALFADGRTEVADILMLTMQDYQRYALFWKGEAGFDLYALENGAEYGAPGMVSAQQPYDAQRAIAGEGGFLTRLGTDAGGYHTIIYSWPSRLADAGPAPEVFIEAEVLEENCGREITATMLTTRDSQVPQSVPLFMEVPGCEAIGRYLVLKNPPLPVRIAAN